MVPSTAIDQSGPVPGHFRQREPLDFAPAPARQHARDARFAAVGDHAALARHHAQQVMELRFDRREVGKDVGVVVLEIVDDRRARPVVHELRALVEEGGVVLVGLDHEERALGQARRAVEVERHAADEEAGIEARVLEDPREHRRCGRLAVRARHRQHPAVGQHVLVQPLRPRHVGVAGVEDRFHQRIAARHHVADHEHVGVTRHARELRRVPAFGEADAEPFELRGHRRIDVGVAPRDDVARRPGDGGEAAHERAADTEDVQVHQLGMR